MEPVNQGGETFGGKVHILVFGTIPPCVPCYQAEQIAREAAASYPEGWVVVEKLEAWSDMGKRLNISLTPAIAVNGKVLAMGRIVPLDELRKTIDDVIHDQRK